MRTLIYTLLTLIILGMFCYSLVANEDPRAVTEHLYEQAQSEINQGNRAFGCKILRDALLVSNHIDDDQKTYYTIWNAGMTMCNWMQNSAIKQVNEEN